MCEPSLNRVPNPFKKTLPIPFKVPTFRRFKNLKSGERVPLKKSLNPCPQLGSKLIPLFKVNGALLFLTLGIFFGGKKFQEIIKNYVLITFLSLIKKPQFLPFPGPKWEFFPLKC